MVNALTVAIILVVAFTPTTGAGHREHGHHHIEADHKDHGDHHIEADHKEHGDHHTEADHSEHGHHQSKTEESEKHSCHEHEEDHGHSHPHAPHGKHWPGEKLAGVHSHGREIHEEREFDVHGFPGSHHHSEHGFAALPPPPTRGWGLWLRAMGCSLLVSLASLICLILLPFIVLHGKPSKTVVDALAGFGAGSMLGDALLHQLPHAFSGAGAHSHPHGSHDHAHELEQEAGGGHAHAHSLKDLSVGLAVLGGILLFFLVEKIVRGTEQLAVHQGRQGHGHSHRHHRLKKDDQKFAGDDNHAKDGTVLSESEKHTSDSRRGIRKRNTGAVEGAEETDLSVSKGIGAKSETDLGGDQTKDEREASFVEKHSEQEEPPRLVLGYLNLFSDGVHNFTDGMALGSAFLLHGTVGGWSRTLFLLAHELPQEVGDFGILVRSGFDVIEALAFNFLSALVALAGTALALLVGGNPGHSTLIEAFTAGGFIYIAVGAVMPDMHSQGSSFKTTICQLAALSSGMGVALVISLAE